MNDHSPTRSNDPETIHARRIGTYNGAEVHGVDIAAPLSDAAFAKILDALHAHGVIFFRGQAPTPEQLAQFSARFGELDVHHMTEHTIPGLPVVRVLSNVKKDGQAVGITRGGMHWHSDLSYKTVPALVTLLYGIECPPAGADTEFVSMYAAYETLPEDVKARIKGKSAIHDRNFRYSALYPNRAPLGPEQIAKVPPVEHPLVRIHPATGRAALFVAKDVVSKIVGMSDADSRALIDFLEAHAIRRETVYAHKWQPGDVLIWDNRCTLHRATDYDNKYRRSLHRTQVKGEVPIPA